MWYFDLSGSMSCGKEWIHMGIKIIYLMVLTKITEKESPLKKMKSNIIPKVWGFSPLKGGRGWHVRSNFNSNEFFYYYYRRDNWYNIHYVIFFLSAWHRILFFNLTLEADSCARVYISCWNIIITLRLLIKF